MFQDQNNSFFGGLGAGLLNSQNPYSQYDRLRQQEVMTQRAYMEKMYAEQAKAINACKPNPGDDPVLLLTGDDE
jgi:chaperonin cofactor prefoldin